MPGQGRKPIRILIVDDHAILRKGLRMLIEDQPGMIVIGEAGNCEDAFEIATREQPEIILLDLDLGGQNGLELLPKLISVSRDTRIIVLTGVRDPEVHHHAIAFGAIGLVFKEQASEVLVKAIEKVHSGEVWFDRTLIATALNRMSRSREAKKNDTEAVRMASLTEREKEVITLVAQGLNRRQIAEKLFISEATVRNHLTSILNKLGVSDRLELAFYAYRHGLAKPPA
ncbi:MAG TPA: response regulator transcription factor [Blastocatellia bacterium]|nr:response regulator transcription factor [Blastocatellia bacterium]